MFPHESIRCAQAFKLLQLVAPNVSLHFAQLTTDAVNAFSASMQRQDEQSRIQITGDKKKMEMDDNY